MSKEFELKMPEEVFNQLYDRWGNSASTSIKEFADSCATWGANQEYEAAHQYILGAVGEGNARIYQEKRRPKIQSEKEKALEALDYIDEMAIFNMKSYQCYESLKEYRNLLYKLIYSLPDEDT